MARLTREQLVVAMIEKSITNEAAIGYSDVLVKLSKFDLLDTIAELERELAEADDRRLAPGPCGKPGHSMSAWKTYNFEPCDHCTLCAQTEAAVQREMEKFTDQFCERHLDTTLSDANVNDKCHLCAAEERGEAAVADLQKQVNDLRKFINEMYETAVCDRPARLAKEIERAAVTEALEKLRERIMGLSYIPPHMRQGDGGMGDREREAPQVKGGEHTQGFPSAKMSRHSPNLGHEGTGAQCRGELASSDPSRSSLQPPSDQRDVIELIEWLRNESEELMGQAIARRGDAKSMDSASVEDLKVSQNIAEKMAGRKLPRTTLRDAKQSAKMNSDIASKLEAEAMKLSGWSDAILPIKQRDETIARRKEAQIWYSEINSVHSIESLRVWAKRRFDSLLDQAHEQREAVARARGWTEAMGFVINLHGEPKP